MKVLKKIVKKCEYKGKENYVLIVDYSHKGEKGTIQVKDYNHLVDDDSAYKYILKQLRVQVRNAYNLKKMEAKS